ncbi:DUF892 family protein [Magnetospirillum sp. UT-4]|uniref:DUF892 family protein n=1 Tax=Magnetospirillum sp. UT-4 TaxID=2681467 RepID=UPI00137DCA2D|nr:DUF892 family protein [Magnetospirillum sp. UT-4]CAA7625866.1 conserved hypothetical protein [Magnetospirillum sp. UT-4]
MNAAMPLIADRGMGEPISLAAMLAAGKKVAPEAVSLLIQDHREAVAFFDWYQHCSDPVEKAEVARRLCTALRAHMTVEEEIFYPAARQATGDDGIVDHSMAEHDEARQLIDHIEALVKSGGGDDDSVAELREVIEDHVADEEEKMFPEVRAAGLDLYDLGCRLAARRGELLFELTGKEIAMADAPLHMDSPQIPIAADQALPLFADGLRNAHAMDKNCREMLERQVDRLENYPAVKNRLSLHLKDKDAQLQRIETILDDMGESPSTMKDMAGSLGGNLSAMMNAPAEDEILKNSAANYAMANLEIATYESLLVLGEAAGKVDAIRVLQQSLSEERAMANWLAEHLRETAVMFMKVKSEGGQASH